MKKIMDKFVTGFFVITLGILWYCSSKYQVNPNQYMILIYDVVGNQIKIDEIRTSFNTHRITNSYISEYQNKFPHYDFSMAVEMPGIKRKILLGIFKKVQR